MEANGLKIDTDYLNRIMVEINTKAHRLEQKLHDDDIFRKTWLRRYGPKANLDSRDQLRSVFFDELGYTSIKGTYTGLRATDEESFKDIDIPFKRRYFRRKKLLNLSRTFLGGIKRELVDGFIHPNINLNMVATYRSSANDPNSMNWPVRNEEQYRYISQCFTPRESDWYSWKLDFRSLEVNINACISEDPVLLDYCKNPKKDMHRDLASGLYMLPKRLINGIVRFYGKNEFTFAEFYGSYYKQIAPKMWDTIHRMKLKIGDTEELISEHLRKKGIKRLGACDHQADTKEGTFEAHVRDQERKLWDLFRGHHEWRKENYEKYKRRGYLITKTGFRIIHGKGGFLTRNDTYSYEPQGCAFHCDLWVLIQLNKWLKKNKMRSVITNEVHDSITGDSPPDELKEVLGKAEELVSVALPKHWPWLIVPLKIEIEVSEQGGSAFTFKEFKLCSSQSVR